MAQRNNLSNFLSNINIFDVTVLLYILLCGDLKSVTIHNLHNTGPTVRSLEGGGHGSAGQLQKSQNIFHSATPALQELSISRPAIELTGMKLCILNLRLQMDKMMRHNDTPFIFK